MNALTAAIDRWIEKAFFPDVTYARTSAPTSPGHGLPGLRPVPATGLDPRWPVRASQP